MDPINYSTDVQGPFQAALQGYQFGAGIRGDQIQQQQQQLMLQQQKVQQQVLQSLMSKPNPTAQDYADATVMVPGMREQLQQAWNMRNQDQQQNDLSHVGQVYAALRSDQPEVAASILTDRAQALKNSGRDEDAKNSSVMADLVRANPSFARTLIGMKLASIPGGDKVITNASNLDENTRKNELQPDLVRKGNAEATKAQAEANAAPETVALKNKDIRSQIAERAGRLRLDRDKLESETGIKIQELQQKNATLPDDARRIVNESTIEATAADQSASQMNDLADRLEKEGGGYGTASRFGEWVKGATGNQNAMTQLRQEYVRLRSQQTMKMLPPGPASDKDIQLALKGFPEDTSDAGTIASFLRGMSKLQQYNATINSAKAEWVNAVGHLGKPKTDIEIDGTTVPAGSTFTDFARQFMQRKADERGAQQSIQQIQNRGYMRFANPGAQ